MSSAGPTKERLQRAVYKLKELKTTPRPEQKISEEAAKKMADDRERMGSEEYTYVYGDDCFVAPCVNGEWCTHCYGNQPNYCANCKLFTYGTYCALCLNRIDYFYNTGSWNCGEEDCYDENCYCNRIKASDAPPRKLLDVSELTDKDKLYIVDDSFIPPSKYDDDD
jgi:hypothetical protein